MRGTFQTDLGTFRIANKLFNFALKFPTKILHAYLLPELKCL